MSWHGGGGPGRRQRKCAAIGDRDRCQRVITINVGRTQFEKATENLIETLSPFSFSF